MLTVMGFLAQMISPVYSARCTYNSHASNSAGHEHLGQWAEPPACSYSVPSLAYVSQAEPKLDIFHRFPVGADPASKKDSFLLHLGTVGLILHCFAPCESFDAPLLGTCLASNCAMGNAGGGPCSHWFLWEWAFVSTLCQCQAQTLFGPLLHTSLCTGMCLSSEALCQEGPKCF